MLQSTPDTVEIPVGRCDKTIVDAIDADLAQFKWHALKDRGYPARPYRWLDRQNKSTSVLLYRVVMERMIGRPLMSHEQVDHIDNDPLNNRRNNLRLATQAQNNRNARRQTGSTGLRGVTYRGPGRYYARIHHCGVEIHLGVFQTAIEAHEAYKEAARKYHGEFAYINQQEAS
jgi:hypothetical protein